MRDGVDPFDCDPDELCPILTNALTCDVDEPGYPVEWTFDAAGAAVCRAFIPAGEAEPAPDTRTLDLFAELGERAP